jgi:hypothetical protein
MSGVLDDLPRVWWSVDLPGYREHPRRPATYSPFEASELPAIERVLDDHLLWLADEQPVEQSIGAEQPGRATEATAGNLTRLLAGAPLALPSAFQSLIAERALQDRVRSCTDCYLDLGEYVVSAGAEGTLIHFLSDSQWVLHWLLYVDSEDEAVVVTQTALGLFDDSPTPTVFDPARTAAAVCADTFNEFLWRFWIENEIWWSLAHTTTPLTPEQQRYLAHYRPG